MLISVIVPVYKVEAYLEQCIRSITEQTYENLEILLVDDGSPDRSGAICDAWAAKDSRIRVIHKENGGAGQARNVALDQAKGELIGFVDSDDFLAPEMYCQLCGLIEKGADIAECGYVELVDDEVSLDDTGGDVAWYSVEAAMAEHLRDGIFRQLIWNKLYRREVIGNIRFPEGNLIDDEFFTYRVIGNAKKLAHLDRALYAYRQQPGSAMHKPYSLKRLEGLRAKAQRLAYLQEKFPRLVPEAQRDLTMTGLYAMQGSLRWLSGAELAQAKEIIAPVMEKSKPEQGETSVSGKKRLLLWAARHDLERTAKVMNFLEDIHLLT